MKLKLIQIATVCDGDNYETLYGLDEDGQVWKKIVCVPAPAPNSTANEWRRVDMEVQA